MKMMQDYYVNNDKQSGGEHEVHVAACPYLPDNHTYLGCFSSCREAVSAARILYVVVDGCGLCACDCHTR